MGGWVTKNDNEWYRRWLSLKGVRWATNKKLKCFLSRAEMLGAANYMEIILLLCPLLIILHRQWWLHNWQLIRLSNACLPRVIINWNQLKHSWLSLCGRTLHQMGSREAVRLLHLIFPLVRRFLVWLLINKFDCNWEMKSIH